MQLKCLNVLQKLRGSIIPGYVSLFEASKGDNNGSSNSNNKHKRRHRSYDRLDSTESLELLLEGVESSSEDERRRRSRRRSFDGFRNGGGNGHSQVNGRAAGASKSV